MNLDRFKNEHELILGDVRDLRALSNAGLVANADRVAAMLITISCKIRTHLAAEDGFLYPELLTSPDVQASQLAQQFQNEMKGIAEAYRSFSSRWCTSKTISDDPDGFRRAATEIFRALNDRIMRENTDLYPVAENLT